MSSYEKGERVVFIPNHVDLFEEEDPDIERGIISKADENASHVKYDQDNKRFEDPDVPYTSERTSNKTLMKEEAFDNMLNFTRIGGKNGVKVFVLEGWLYESEDNYNKGRHGKYKIPIESIATVDQSNEQTWVKLCSGDVVIGESKESN